MNTFRLFLDTITLFHCLIFPHMNCLFYIWPPPPLFIYIPITLSFFIFLYIINFSHIVFSQFLHDIFPTQFIIYLHAIYTYNSLIFTWFFFFTIHFFSQEFSAWLIYLYMWYSPKEYIYVHIFTIHIFSLHFLNMINLFSRDFFFF